MRARWRVLAVPVLLLVSLCVAGCGDGATAPGQFTAVVGADGATLNLPGGATLGIPAGAVSSPTKVTAEVVAAEARAETVAPIDTVWRLEPAGLRLAKPATLRLPYTGATRPLPRTAHRATGAQAWAEAIGSVARTGSVEVPIERLGDYAVARRSGAEPAGGRLVCWVTGSDRGIGNAHVEITAGPSVAGPVAASAAGASEHEGLQPGTYSLRVTAVGYQSAERTGLAVSAGTTTQVSVVMAREGALAGSIAGIVRHTSGGALANVTLTVLDGPAMGRTAVTDSTGAYLLSGLPEGRYSLAANHASYPSQTLGGIDVLAGATAHADFTLGDTGGQPFGRIAGHVRSLSGAPLPGAIVAVAAGPTVGRSATADEEGAYELTLVLQGAYSMRASADGYGTQSNDITVAGGATATCDFRLGPGAATTGRVWGYARSMGDDPIVGVTVRVLEGPTHEQVLTASQGHYSLEALAPGDYTVEAGGAGYVATTAGATVEAGRNTQRDFLIPRLGPNGESAYLTGHVRDTAGNPLDGATVETLTGPSAGSDDSGADGHYGIDALAEGSYTVRASLAGYDPQTQAAQVRSGANTLDFVLAPQPAHVSGHVRDRSGAGLAGATVAVVEGPTSASVTTDSTGAYDLPPLEAGVYLLGASLEGYVAVQRSVSLSPGAVEAIDFTLLTLPARIVGTVSDAAGGRLSGATVEVVTGPTDASDTTDSSGAYLLDGLEEGAYTIRASRDGYHEETASTTLSARETATLDITLVPFRGEITGTVEDTLGRGVSGATVSVTDGPGDAQATTDSSGAYRLADLSPGEYDLEASCGGYGSDTATVTVRPGETSTADFVIAAIPGGITGSARDTDGYPLAGVTIRVTGGPTSPADVLTDSGGDYSVDSLLPGAYTVTGSKRGYLATSDEVVVAAGDTATLDLALPFDPYAYVTLSGYVHAHEGTAVAGATVTVRNRLGQTSSVVTTGAGTYRFSSLLAGLYTVTASKSGIGTDTADVRLLPYETRTLNFVLQ